MYIQAYTVWSLPYPFFICSYRIYIPSSAFGSNPFKINNFGSRLVTSYPTHRTHVKCLGSRNSRGYRHVCSLHLRREHRWENSTRRRTTEISYRPGSSSSSSSSLFTSSVHYSVSAEASLSTLIAALYLPVPLAFLLIPSQPIWLPQTWLTTRRWPIISDSLLLQVCLQFCWERCYLFIYYFAL